MGQRRQCDQAATRMHVDGRPRAARVHLPIQQQRTSSAPAAVAVAQANAAADQAQACGVDLVGWRRCDIHKAMVMAAVGE